MMASQQSLLPGETSTDTASVNAVPDRGAWLPLVLKQIDLLTMHLSDQHKRLQQEIYTRLAARSSLLNYTIATVGGIAGIMTLVFPKGNTSSFLVDQNIVDIALMSIICFLGAFIFLFFYMNYLSHSGYIYTASRQISEQFPQLLDEIQQLACRAGRECGAPPSVLVPMKSEKIFAWEHEITNIRNRVQFTDSKFEIRGYIALSMISFVLSILSFLCYLWLLLSGHSGQGAMIMAMISGMVFLVFVLLYSVAFVRCRTTFKAVMSFRDAKLARSTIRTDGDGQP